MTSVARKGTLGTFQNLKKGFHKISCISAISAYIFIKDCTDLLKTLLVDKQVLKSDDPDQQPRHGRG